MLEAYRKRMPPFHFLLPRLTVLEFQADDLLLVLVTDVIQIEGTVMMRSIFSVFFLFSLLYIGSAVTIRGILGDWFGGGSLSPCNGCPFRNCLHDRAVVLGYCCGCARVSDFLPIDCPGLRLNCPPDGRRLCRDYDYMLNCCCP